ncbi:hypothetical protein PVK06_026564 [Gossypium arboreum]|uniref:Uncharacterized protein n=1 Tax=Gossypium arboreum TaxID=29729 RepID=A0ABR0NZA3_GOSAR|nr:hypothetical protein PVK06_026564 [Gossypium arboreum]
MELEDDEDVETIVVPYCWYWSHQTDLIQLFAELADVQPAKDSTPLVYIDRQSTVRGIDIDLNAPPTSENLNLGPRLQIHPVVIETNADGDDVYDNNGSSNHNVERL